MPSATLLLLLNVLAAGETAGTGKDITVAIFELRARGLSDRAADALLDVVSEEVAKVPGLKVLSRKDIQAILTEESRKQLSGCDSSSCLSELAGALNAEWLVTGEAARLGEGTLLTLQLINHRYANVMNRVSVLWKGPQEDLPDVTRAASQLLALPAEHRSPGKLKVEGAPGGATLSIDEKPVPGLTVDALEVGVHTARVAADGHEDREIPFVVLSGKKVTLNGRLASIPVFRRPWFWGLSAVGVGAVATLAAVVVGGVPLVLVVWNTGGASVRSRSAAPPVGGS
ncbi:MAG: hypothetical protein HY904_18695 [Deltaproteobacteria bacterium]|nr:hypothetical protein [Deltaproteobacteria bacterium]